MCVSSTGPYSSTSSISSARVKSLGSLATHSHAVCPVCLVSTRRQVRTTRRSDKRSSQTHERRQTTCIGFQVRYGCLNPFPLPGLMGASMVEPSVARARV